MLADWETNTVLISELLIQRQPEIVRQLEALLFEHEVPLIVVQETADIWIRDAAPIQVDDGHFTQFCYRPDYLRDRYEHRITAPAVFQNLEFVGQPENSNLIVDGGNIVGTRSVAILTDKVVRENRNRIRSEITAELRKLLRVENVVLIPKEPYDPIGHTDGMVRFVTDDHVVVNDYREVDPPFAGRLEAVLTARRIAFTRIPYVPECRLRDGIPTAVGNYANFLRVGQFVLIPAYGLREDEVARKILANLLPACRVVSLPCRDLAEDGGVWNCVTWTIRRANQQAENK